MLRLVKTKKKPSEKGVGGDGLAAILLVALNETISPNQPKKNLRRATVTSNVARTKNKSSTSATTTSEDTKNKSPVALHPSPEDARKCPPDESIEVDKQKQKVTTLWSRGKPKKVVVVNLPKGKDNGPPSNENDVSFCSQCNDMYNSSLSTPRKKCCETETHVSLNKVGEYVLILAKTVH
jgi:hypothetical protein